MIRSVAAAAFFCRSCHSFRRLFGSVCGSNNMRCMTRTSHLFLGTDFRTAFRDQVLLDFFVAGLLFEAARVLLARGLFFDKASTCCRSKSRAAAWACLSPDVSAAI